MFRIMKNSCSFDVLKISYIKYIKVMKQLSVIFISWFLSAFSYKAMAQDEPKLKEKKKTEEIIIRKSGEKDINMTIQITGDKVIINGKPLAEFKDDNITVNKRKIIVRDGDHFAMLDGMGNFEMENFAWNYEGGSKVLLGVNTEKTAGGAMITEVTKGSAAEKAGLQKGDIITKLGDIKIEDPQDLYDAVNKKNANDEVRIDYKRDGKEKSAKAVIQERKEKSFGLTTPKGDYKSYTIPRSRTIPKVRDHNNPNPDFELNKHLELAFAFSGRPKLGLKIQDLEEEKGVKVLSVEENSASAKAGMKKDDVIVEIGGRKVLNTDDAREALHENESKSNYIIKAKRNGTEMSFDIKIPKKLKTANL